MKVIIRNAKNLLVDGKVDKVSENFWEVADEEVRKIIMPGRTTFSCTCENHVRFCNDHPICYHIMAAILFESDAGFYTKVNQLIREYEKTIELGLTNEPATIIEDLKNLRYLK